MFVQLSGQVRLKVYEVVWAANEIPDFQPTDTFKEALSDPAGNILFFLVVCLIIGSVGTIVIGFIKASGKVLAWGAAGLIVGLMLFSPSDTFELVKGIFDKVSM